VHIRLGDTEKRGDLALAVRVPREHKQPHTYTSSNNQTTKIGEMASSNGEEVAAGNINPQLQGQGPLVCEE
jgi:hypothetical protein